MANKPPKSSDGDNWGCALGIALYAWATVAFWILWWWSDSEIIEILVIGSFGVAIVAFFVALSWLKEDEKPHVPSPPPPSQPARQQPPSYPSYLSYTGASRRTEYQEYLKSPEWAATRKRALARAEYRCQVCNRSDQLEVHHRTYANLGNELPQDLTVLCASCHGLFHAGGNMPETGVQHRGMSQDLTDQERDPDMPDDFRIIGVTVEGGYAYEDREGHHYRKMTDNTYRRMWTNPNPKIPYRYNPIPHMGYPQRKDGA